MSAADGQPTVHAASPALTTAGAPAASTGPSIWGIHAADLAAAPGRSTTEVSV
ncbi:hypothetical protein [Kribbella endophytica]